MAHHCPSDRVMNDPVQFHQWFVHQFHHGSFVPNQKLGCIRIDDKLRSVVALLLLWLFSASSSLCHVRRFGLRPPLFGTLWHVGVALCHVRRFRLWPPSADWEALNARCSVLACNRPASFMSSRRRLLASVLFRETNAAFFLGRPPLLR